MTQKIGIIGVGLMGLGIATNVQKAGWELHFLDHPGNQPTKELTSGGAISHNTAKALTQVCDSIILCVTGAPQIEDVMLSENGVLAGLSPGKMVIDCSTSLPKTTEKIALAVQNVGGKYIDAPMTRTPKEAAEGRLNLIVGGASEDLQAARPLLESFAENIAHAGNVGAGHAMKLLHNFVSLGFSAVLAEAASVARDSGVEGTVFQEILATGGGAGIVLDRMTPYILAGECENFRFSLSNGNKDIGYYREMAAQTGSAHELADAVGSMFSEMVDGGHGDRFLPELISLLREK